MEALPSLVAVFAPMFRWEVLAACLLGGSLVVSLALGIGFSNARRDRRLGLYRSTVWESIDGSVLEVIKEDAGKLRFHMETVAVERLLPKGREALERTLEETRQSIDALLVKIRTARLP
ncbi:MAG: hypothetical protein Q8R13_05575 [bacterium]|nr:hypothetical protein [bacterium]MDZ4296464.1 hypothetical protein [Patescibacteria group bacterium]